MPGRRGSSAEGRRTPARLILRAVTSGPTEDRAREREHRKSTKRGDHGVSVPSREEGAAVPSPVMAVEAAALPADDVLARLGSGTPGLAED
jgi:hypothetical protein